MGNGRKFKRLLHMQQQKKVNFNKEITDSKGRFAVIYVGKDGELHYRAQDIMVGEALMNAYYISITPEKWEAYKKYIEENRERLNPSPTSKIITLPGAITDL